MSKAKQRLIHIIVTIGLTILFFCLVFFLRGIYNFRGLCDAFFVSGVFMLGTTLIIFMGEKGLFDMMGYGLYRLVGTLRPQENLRFRNAYDFKQDKLEKRSKTPFFFLPYFISAGILLTIAVVLVIILAANNYAL